jgi:hypothetical protein
MSKPLQWFFQASHIIRTIKYVMNDFISHSKSIAPLIAACNGAPGTPRPAKFIPALKYYPLKIREIFKRQFFFRQYKKRGTYCITAFVGSSCIRPHIKPEKIYVAA